MGLDEIINKIESDAEARKRQIVEAAKAEADRILKDAKAKADEKLSQAKAKAASESKVIITRESSRAQTEASQMYQKRLNEEVNRSIESIRSGFQGYTRSDEYAKLLQKLAGKAAGELGEGCIVYARPEDAARIKPEGFSVAVSQEAISGGIRAVSRDGFRYVDYTLDAILSGISDGIAVEILKIIK